MFFFGQFFFVLYSMLLELKGYFEDDGWFDQIVGLVMMGCFIGGFFGIQVVFCVFYRFMFFYVVDCDYLYDE